MQEGTPDPPARGSCELPSQARPTSLRCAGGMGPGGPWRRPRVALPGKVHTLGKAGV